MIRIARLLYVSWFFNLKQLTRSGLFIFTSIVDRKSVV